MNICKPNAASRFDSRPGTMTIRKRWPWRACPLALLLVVCSARPMSGAGAGAATQPAARAGLFPLESVRLLDGPFKEAQEVDRKYLLAHDPDRLLAPFRHEAGLPEKAPRYGNWES